MDGLNNAGRGPMSARRLSDRGSRRSRPTVQPLDARVLLSAGGAAPDAYAQYMLELINRARANPAAEAQRLVALAQNDPILKVTTNGEDLSQFVQTLTSYGPEAPLAFSPALDQVARDHNAAMLAANTQFHTPTGTNGQIYGENIYAYSLIVTSSDPKDAVNFFDEAFFLDWGNPEFGHLKNLMWPSPGASPSTGINEIGIDLMTGVYPTTPPAPGSAYPGFNVGPDMMTQEFGTSVGNAFLTGVAFRNSDGSGFYAPGEGLGGVTIQAVGRNGQGSFQTSTWSSGGYSLPLPRGTYDITASGGGLPTNQTTVATIGADNVAWDVIADPAPAVPTVVGPDPSPPAVVAPTTLAPVVAPTTLAPVVAPTTPDPPVVTPPPAHASPSQASTRAGAILALRVNHATSHPHHTLKMRIGAREWPHRSR